MLKVLLVIEDYNELVYIQGLLRKLGFDVDGMQNQRKLSESLLTFRPQVVIATSHGKQVDGAAICQKINKRSGWPKIILIDNPIMSAIKTTEVPGIVDHVLQSPVSVPQVISVLSDYGDLDKETLLAKFAKFKGQSPTEEASIGRFADGGETSSVQVFKGQPTTTENITLREEGPEFVEGEQVHSSSVAQEQSEIVVKGGRRGAAEAPKVRGSVEPEGTGQVSELHKVKGASERGQTGGGAEPRESSSKNRTSSLLDTPTGAQESGEGSAGQQRGNQGAVSSTSPRGELDQRAVAAAAGQTVQQTSKTSVPNISPTVISMEERRQRFAKVLLEVGDQKKSHFNTEKVREFHKQIRDVEKQEQTEELEEERKRFVVALFSKK